jgi:hypothetical protein
MSQQDIPLYVDGDEVALVKAMGRYPRHFKGVVISRTSDKVPAFKGDITLNVRMEDGEILVLRSDEIYYAYQFPELSWRRGSNLASVVVHGLQLRENGRWVIPDFQRELVWTLEQKIRFIESLVLGLPVGEYTLHQTPDYKYEVLDGQQRWNAIFEYVDGKFPVFGYFWKDLNTTSKLGFEHLSFPHRACEGYTYAQKLDAYNRLAYGGTPHD